MTSGGIPTGTIENGGGVLIINDVYQTPTTDNNEGNNYFFTNTQQTITYKWSTNNTTTTCANGQIRVTGSGGINVGLSNQDLNGFDREGLSAH